MFKFVPIGTTNINILMNFKITFVKETKNPAILSRNKVLFDSQFFLDKKYYQILLCMKVDWKIIVNNTMLDDQYSDLSIYKIEIESGLGMYNQLRNSRTADTYGLIFHMNVSIAF